MATSLAGEGYDRGKEIQSLCTALKLAERKASPKLSPNASMHTRRGERDRGRESLIENGSSADSDSEKTTLLPDTVLEWTPLSSCLHLPRQVVR